MNSITTHLEYSCGRLFSFVWANGRSHQGRIHVSVPDPVFQGLSHAPALLATAAELCALHELLVLRALFGKDRAGNNLEICSSSQELRALAGARSAHPELASFAGFLATRFSDATFTHARDAGWLKPRAEQNVTTLTLFSPLDDTVSIRELGAVALTRHLIEQYRMRCNWPEAFEAWRAVVLLARGEWLDVPVSEIDARYYEAKHGVVGRLLWSRHSKWMLVLAQRPGEPLRALTLYYVERRPRGAVELRLAHSSAAAAAAESSSAAAAASASACSPCFSISSTDFPPAVSPRPSQPLASRKETTT